MLVMAPVGRMHFQECTLPWCWPGDLFGQCDGREVGLESWASLLDSSNLSREECSPGVCDTFPLGSRMKAHLGNLSPAHGLGSRTQDPGLEALRLRAPVGQTTLELPNPKHRNAFLLPPRLWHATNADYYCLKC